ncbi:MAG TPA: cyclic nucleotide-binding domain-containing protein [bacterium]|nr:cyclic nucleotide-binding domain-containing protein [bacterium]
MKSIPIIKYGGKFSTIWNLLIVLCILIISLTIPYQICFNIFKYDSLFWTITGIFIIDIFISLDSEKKIGIKYLKTRKEIIEYYLKKWFILDLFAALPIAYFLQKYCDNSKYQYLIIFYQLLRLLKFFKAFSLFTDIQNSLNIIPSIMRLTKFIFLTYMQVVNLMSLGWVLVGGVPNINELEFTSLEKYLRGLYWCMTTITTIGYGDYSPDKSNNIQIIYTVFVQIIGVGIYSYIIANVAGLIANLDIAKANYMKKIEEISVFMRGKNIPIDIQEKVKNYYEYSWETNKNISETSVMSELPRLLALDISLFLNRGILQKVSFFKNADDIFIREIVQMLKQSTFIPGDYIIRQGEYGDCMYFLSSGQVEVLVNDNKVAVLQEGSPFGETALLQGEKRNASIRALNYCDVYILTKENFDIIRGKYVDFNNQMLKIIEERAKANKK